MSLNSALIWYQRKIGTYDKQMWEKTVEQQILRGLGNVPKKLTRLKTELIDVDLVRGSTFPKAKPQHGAVVAAQRGLAKVLLLPLYFNWWKRQTNIWVSSLLLTTYILQFCNTATYLLHSKNHKDSVENKDISLVEILLPALLMLVLGVIHSQVVATMITSGRNSCRAKQKRKRIKRRSTSKYSSTPCVTVDRSVSCGSFPFAYYCGNEANGGVKKSDNVIKTNKRNNDNTNEKPETKCIQETSCHETDDSASHTSESSPHTAHVVSDDKSDMDTRNNDSAVQDISSGDIETDLLPSDVEAERKTSTSKQNRTTASPNFDSKRTLLRRRAPRTLCFSQTVRQHESSCNSSCESEAETTSPNTPLKEQTSDGDWGMTTNTECDNSYSSNMETDEDGLVVEDPFGWKLQGNSAILNNALPTSDKVSCTIWEGKDVHKVDFSVLDICSVIIQRVDNTAIGTDYLVAGLGFATMVALLPAALRIHDTLTTQPDELQSAGNSSLNYVATLLSLGIGDNLKARTIVLAAKFNNFCLSMIFFFLLAVAERTFKQRFLYAKLFSHLTSSRRARKSDLPHFRLNKVRNIKTWLSVRSYLKRHGPQRSVDVIVSAAFMLAFVVICFLCFQLMKDSENFGHALLHWELVVWTLALGVYLLRFMTLGAKINKKYGNPSVLITEQINLYLQMEQKPHKKEGLNLANNVLKLAADLLKELESPFKISGLSANPYLYNITKLVILSAFSAVVKEVLGFKLKLYKIKI